jgi:hypothetical protein
MFTSCLPPAKRKLWFAYATSSFDLDLWIIALKAINFVGLAPSLKPIFVLSYVDVEGYTMQTSSSKCSQLIINFESWFLSAHLSIEQAFKIAFVP